MIDTTLARRSNKPKTKLAKRAAHKSATSLLADNPRLQIAFGYMRACQRKDKKEVMEIMPFIISVARGAMDMGRRDLFVARPGPHPN